MYSGVGGEILYRPFQKTFAVGAEIWKVKKRNPASALGLANQFSNPTTAHLNLWYQLPNSNVTSFAKIGQYLGEDLGATLGIETKFKNGTRLKGFVTATNEADSNLFGGTSHLYSGIELKLPIGNIPYVPKGSRIDTSFVPLARDAGQTLDVPVSLYEVTAPWQYPEIAQSWEDFLN